MTPAARPMNWMSRERLSVAVGVTLIVALCSACRGSSPNSGATRAGSATDARASANSAPSTGPVSSAPSIGPSGCGPSYQFPICPLPAPTGLEQQAATMAQRTVSRGYPQVNDLAPLPDGATEYQLTLRYGRIEDALPGEDACYSPGAAYPSGSGPLIDQHTITLRGDTRAQQCSFNMSAAPWSVVQIMWHEGGNIFWAGVAHLVRGAQTGPAPSSFPVDQLIAAAKRWAPSSS